MATTWLSRLLGRLIKWLGLFVRKRPSEDREVLQKRLTKDRALSKLLVLFTKNSSHDLEIFDSAGLANQQLRGTNQFAALFKKSFLYKRIGFYVSPYRVFSRLRIHNSLQGLFAQMSPAKDRALLQKNHTKDRAFSKGLLLCLRKDQMWLSQEKYGVATISRLLKTTGLFCRIWSLL